jgi:hypothetical protein
MTDKEILEEARKVRNPIENYKLIELEKQCKSEKTKKRIENKFRLLYLREQL